MNELLRIGLTGGIGSGKSTVSDMFSELGVPIIDADLISHEVTAKDQQAYHAIVKNFGSDILSGSGQIQRNLLRDIVFSDTSKRKQLEDIIHPIVRKEIQRRVSECNYPYCIISVPLLLETDSKYTVDRVLVIDIPEKLQSIRASKRDDRIISDIEKIISAQIDRDDRLRLADDVINNDQDITYLNNQVNSLHQKYLYIAKQPATDSA